jgi:hypothetical protein
MDTHNVMGFTDVTSLKHIDKIINTPKHKKKIIIGNAIHF